jgi:hypothetical protein
VRAIGRLRHARQHEPQQDAHATIAFDVDQ